MNNPVMSPDFREEVFRAEHQACLIQPPLPKLLHSLSQSHRCSYSIWQARKWVDWVSTFILWVILGLNMEKGIAEELCGSLRKMKRNPLLIGVYWKEAIRNFMESTQRDRAVVLPTQMGWI
ncbi:hypothetical protein L6164_017182 [Bauhinia variegata]|uniref:Uncharacterized protein n=1 Tax=Bauhinia variegata TaxID=167791 RepID=A0ACB9N7B3_BAUVA|nr:hypothetical protein L6164_017182 [Bauhinia variegata]